MMDHTDLPLYEIVAAASLNPARAIGIDGAKGSIAPGEDADIILADGNFEIQKTIIEGEIRYESKV